MKLNKLRFQFLVLGVLLGSSMGLFGQSSTFQIGLDATFILDFAVGPDSTIFILKAKTNLQNFKFEVGLAILNKNGQVIRSKKIELADEYTLLLHGNKILVNKDGSIYLLLHYSKSVQSWKILVYLDKNFNVLHKCNNLVPSNNGNHYFSTESNVLKSRILWLPNIPPKELNTVIVQHNLIDDKFVFENFELSNRQYDIILSDATFIADHSYLIHAELQNNRTVHYSLTKLNNISKENTIHRFNFDPYDINSDYDNNLILLGSNANGEIIISKYTAELQLVWSKRVRVSQKWSDYIFQNSLVTDAEGNIYLNIKESLPELNIGTKLLKLDKNGNLIYHKIILDATHKGVNDAQIFDNHLLFSLGLDLSTFMRKLPLSGDADDCVSIPVCTEIEDFDAQLFKTDYNLVKIGETVPTNDLDITILPDETKTFHYCEPFFPPDPVFDIFSHQFCVGDTLVIDTSLVYKYGLSEWTLTVENNPKIQVQKYPEPFILDKSGQYSVQHRLIFGGCEYIDTLQIKVVEPINDQLPKKITICENEAKTLSLPQDSANDILWSDGTNSNTLTIVEAGNYSVNYKDNNGCKKTENIMSNIKYLPTIQLGDDINPCKDSLVVINIPKENDSRIMWSDGTDDNQKVIANEGRYMVTITNECGEASDEIYIEYKDCSSTFEYSNIFSPNGDGNNDQFVLMGDNISEISIRFYDRWGNLVHKNDYEDGSNITWDGKYLQNPVTLGIYTFVMRYKENISGKINIVNGNTTVIY
jgi:gliding motility-associated-like protein